MEELGLLNYSSISLPVLLEFCILLSITQIKYPHFIDARHPNYIN